VTFAQLLLEIRRRAAALPDDGRRPAALGQIAREVLDEIPEGEQSAQMRCIVAEFLGLSQGHEFNARLLDQMTRELDMIASELLKVGRMNEAVRALRGALIRPVN
jgi:hypothetical protein